MGRTEEKAALRLRLKEQRAALTEEQTAVWDSAISRNVTESDWFKQADTVFAYFSTPQEVDTLAILAAARQMGKAVALPRCAERGIMHFFLVEGEKDLSAGRFGIPEPGEGCAAAKPTSRSLCLVPGLSFDHRGFRIGYGGGYYDRFLAAFPGKSLGLVRSAFLSETVPTDQYDLAADGFVTEQGFYKIK